MSRVTSYLRLSAAERRDAHRAIAALIWARAVYRRHSLARLFGQPAEQCHAELGTAEQARRIGVAIARARKALPWNARCLEQALAARRMLMAEAQPGSVYIGVKRGESEPLESHAWVLSGGRAVTGGSDNSAFQVLARYVF